MLYFELRPARKNYITTILQQQDSGSRKCDASDDSDSNKRPYAYDAMSAGSIIERNYTNLPGAKQACKVAPKQRPSE